MKIVGLVVNIQQEAVLLACKDDVDFEGVKELYADDGEGDLDVYTGFDLHALEPFSGMDDPELVEFLRRFNDGEYGEANFAIRLDGGLGKPKCIAVCTNPEEGNPIIDAATGKVLYDSIMVTSSDNPEERDDYDEIMGFKVG